MKKQVNIIVPCLLVLVSCGKPAPPRDFTKIEMVSVPAGDFKMGGNDDRLRTVNLDAFWIGKNDITVAEFRAYCSAKRIDFGKFKAPEWGWRDDHPMVNVSWQEARDYCNWAGGDLPTEAQWEKAARGTDGREYPWGDEYDANKLCCSKNRYGDANSTAPVGSFPDGASPYGCLDMAGNVWQWCLDVKVPDAHPPAGSRPESGERRVTKGCAWSYWTDESFRCARRGGSVPTYRSDRTGFRLVRSSAR